MLEGCTHRKNIEAESTASSLMFRSIRRRSLIRTAFGTMVLGVTGRPSAGNEPVMVYAAATLKDALDAVIGAGRSSLHIQVTLVYGPLRHWCSNCRTVRPAISSSLPTPIG
jgi:hypothetical protein